MSLVEAGVAVRVVNAPVPAVVAPMETKLAAPAPEIFQLSSSRAKEEEAVVVPMVIELATAPVPILIVSAVVPPVPMDMVSAPVPVPILMALVILVEPIFKVEAALTRLKVEAVVVTSPPFTAILPPKVEIPVPRKLKALLSVAFPNERAFVVPSRAIILFGPSSRTTKFDPSPY